MKVRNIITLTLNPAIDKHIFRSEDGEGEKISYSGVGGKGVNVSVALSKCGFPSTCYVFCGRAGAEDYLEGLSRLLPDVIYDIGEGAVRENIHVHTDLDDSVSFGEGAPVREKDAQGLLSRLEELVTPGCVLCFSGSVAKGSDKAGIIKALKRANELGAEILLDSRSFTLAQISEIKPKLIKPNIDELRALLEENESMDISSALKRIHSCGVERVLLTLGGDGLVYSTERGSVKKTGVPITPVSTTGAGDSTLAAYIIADTLGFSDEETAELALAFGTVTCTVSDSFPPDACQISRYFSKRNFTL